MKLNPISRFKFSSTLPVKVDGGEFILYLLIWTNYVCAMTFTEVKLYLFILNYLKFCVAH